jgi:drug/metabolite transporter (DMT)-like permease
MFYLILAFCSSALVSIVMRLSDGKITNRMGMLAVNYMICSLLAAADAGFGDLLPRSTLTLGLGFINGLFYLGGFVFFQRSVSRSGVVLSATFMKLGLLVSILISILFFGEKPDIMQILGFVLAVAAIVMINYKSGEGTFNMGLLLLLFIGGMCDGMSKVYEELGDPALSGQFLFYTFFTALALCLVMGRGKLPGAREWIYGAAIGVPNFYASQFMLQALGTVPGVIAYPVYSVAGILLVTLAGVVFFWERLEKRQWMALGIILLALILLNV